MNVLKTEGYDITHLNSNTAISTQEVLKKEVYTIQFFIEQDKLPKEIHQISIYFKENNKIKVVKAAIINKPDLIVSSKTNKKITHN